MDSPSSSSSPPPGKKPIKRARAVRVCTRCKTQKLKCDRGEPCSSCARASLGHRCIYNAWSHHPPKETTDELTLRVAQLEGELRRLRSPTHTPPRRITATSLPSIIQAIPSSGVCSKCLDQFAKFDVNYRTTHIPSFRRRADHLLNNLASSSIEDAPLLALILIAMAIGAEREASLESIDHSLPIAFDDLYARTIELIESRPDLLNLDYVRALHLKTVRLKHGSLSSPALTWVALGKAISAARWLRLDQPDGEWSFEAEMKKRLWCQITTSERLLMEMLRLTGPCSPPLTPAQIPLIIADTALETGDLESNTIAEWSYVAIKLRYVHITSAITAMLPTDTQPTLAQFTAAHALLTDFEQTFDPHFRVDRTPSFDEPPWAYGQGCVIVMGLMHATILLYEKGFRSPDQAVQSVCHQQALRASERLIKTFQSLYTHVLFKWPDGRPLNIWACGGKIFEAAMAIASVLVVEPSVQIIERRAMFAEAIRSLELMTAEPTKCPMNDQSLAILRRVKVLLDQGENPFLGEVGKERDPLTGVKLDSRAVRVTLSNDEWLDWSQWESMFPGLL